MSEDPEKSKSMSISIDDQIDKLLEIENLDKLVGKYFEDNQNHAFAGVLFDTLEDHGSQANPNKISVSDLLALNLLDVRVGPIEIRKLLSGDFDSGLANVNADCDIWNPQEDALQCASELWVELKEVKGLGRTKISKLCARKRPRLIPITDSIVERVLKIKVKDNPLAIWQELGNALNDERRNKIKDLIPNSVGYKPTILRTLDVAIWMIGSNSKAAQKSRSEVNLPKEPIY